MKPTLTPRAESVFLSCGPVARTRRLSVTVESVPKVRSTEVASALTYIWRRRTVTLSIRFNTIVQYVQSIERAQMAQKRKGTRFSLTRSYTVMRAQAEGVPVWFPFGDAGYPSCTDQIMTWQTINHAPVLWRGRGTRGTDAQHDTRHIRSTLQPTRPSPPLLHHTPSARPAGASIDPSRQLTLV